ncbi:hypothetical protein NDU88_001920 [Pleurodeles waltl]|uniref:Uncharacterized protein n=1 Tax=Pleurodeles waltl TaxID=8319 RepID=A0AAV7Q529_PLEWA|nr:hypothetical protein NDU88_001920 [Pleurodeles waltl]
MVSRRAQLYNPSPAYVAQCSPLLLTAHHTMEAAASGRVKTSQWLFLPCYGCSATWPMPSERPDAPVPAGSVRTMTRIPHGCVELCILISACGLRAPPSRCPATSVKRPEYPVCQ